MITLKHLARAINEDPYKLRKRLRKLYGNVKRKRWSWETERDEDYLRVLRDLTTSKKKAPIRLSSTTRAKSSHKGVTRS